MKAYHIDTGDFLTKAIKEKHLQTINLQRIPYEWENRKELVNRYPGGLSQWGLSILGVQYKFDSRALNLGFQEKDGRYMWDSYLIDVIYEYERLLRFPEKNSRFQSIFALETLDEALSWNQYFGNSHKKIYEIEFDENQAIKCESKFLSGSVNPFNLLFMQDEANSYWSGYSKNSKDSMKELIIKLPVKILGEVSS